MEALVRLRRNAKAHLWFSQVPAPPDVAISMHVWPAKASPCCIDPRLIVGMRPREMSSTGGRDTGERPGGGTHGAGGAARHRRVQLVGDARRGQRLHLGRYLPRPLGGSQSRRGHDGAAAVPQARLPLAPAPGQPLGAIHQ